MKVVGNMLVRNEDWILRCSLSVALDWCDAVVVYLDGCTDGTWEECVAQAVEHPGRVFPVQRNREPDAPWHEMALRHRMLEVSRDLGATHVAIIDADEWLTPSRVKTIRSDMERLAPGDILDVPMVPLWRGIRTKRVDECVWTRSQLTVAFADAPFLCYAPAEGSGYEHHGRPPRNYRRRLLSPGCGAIHAQWLDWDRLVAKHVWYRMMEWHRWPGRTSKVELNRKYDQALDERGLQLAQLSPGEYDPRSEGIRIGKVPWHLEAIRLWAGRLPGRDAFEGLDLKGLA